PARQLDAALADMRVERAAPVPVLEALDEFEGMRAPRRVDDRLLGGIRMAIPNVAADRAVQQRGVLRHHADLRPQAFLGQPGDVLAVDQDATALRPVEAEQQMHEGRFSGAGAADQADPLARRDVELETAQYAAAAWAATIIKAHALETD